MISFFRHHLQGRFLRYTVYVVSFLVVFPTSLAIFMRWFNVGGSDWVVKVNSSSIGYAQYQQREQEISRQVEQLKSILGDKAQAVLASQGLAGDPKTITINNLILQALFDSSAKKVGIHISPSYRQLYMMRSLPRQFLLPNGEINRALVEQTYHVSFEQLEQQQEQRIKEETLLQFTNGAIYLPLFVLKDYYMCEYADHKFLIAKIPLARFIEQEKKQVLIDKDLQEFFAAENRKSRRYFVPERRSGIAWTFNPDQYGITITDNQIKRYYERNKPTEFILAPAQIQVRQLVMPFTDATKNDVHLKMNQERQAFVQKPELFAQKSELLNFFARGTHDQLFEQEAFKLATDGAISPVFETAKGLCILQRVARKTPTYKTLESVRNTIIHVLRVEQFKYSFPHMVRRIVAQENKEQAFADFARERGAKQHVITNAATDESLLTQKLFATRLNNIGATIDGDHGVAVLVNRIDKAYEPSLERIKTQVINDYYHARAERALKNVLHKADVLTTTEQFMQFVREQGAHVESTGFVNAHTPEQVKKLKASFGQASDRLFAMSSPGSVAVYLGSDMGYAACLEAVAPFDEQKFQAHKGELAFAALRSQRILIEQGFVASLCRNATIKVNEKLRT